MPIKLVSQLAKSIVIEVEIHNKLQMEAFLLNRVVLDYSYFGCTGEFRVMFFGASGFTCKETINHEIHNIYISISLGMKRGRHK